jgi:hypothetical protein
MKEGVREEVKESLEEVKEGVREEVKESLRELSPAPRPDSHTDGHDHEKGTGHLMHKWQHYCTGLNCEGENPDFKDETQCEGCGMHLGSVDVATSLSRCPSCGGHKVKKL